MTTRSKTFSLPSELADRLDSYPRSELPNLSKLIVRLLTRELDRLDAARARQAEKSKAKQQA